MLYIKNIKLAATLLNSKLAIAVQKNKGDVIQEIIAALVRQTGYIKTIKYWRYKGVFWYVYRRNFLGNKPIKL